MGALSPASSTLLKGTLQTSCNSYTVTFSVRETDFVLEEKWQAWECNYFLLSCYQMVFLAGGKLNKDPQKHADLLKYFASTLCSMLSIESLRQLKHGNDAASLSVHQLHPT